MSVLLELSCGEIVLDLFVEECPIACRNFIKLCKLKYYNSYLLWNVQQGYIVQTGDPTATGKGGSSIYGLLHTKSHDGGFADEITTTRPINRAGLVCMANSGKPNTNKSQFFITLSNEHLTNLDGKHTVFAEVAEGFDTLAVINNLYCDEEGRPFQDVRIRHTYILDDPFDDPPGLVEPPQSPIRNRPEDEKVSARIPYEEDLNAGTDAKTEKELEESIRRKEAQSRAIVLEMTGDIPDADVKPPEEVLFVCKLNPVTRDEDLELIFSRFGRIKQCEIIRDMKTGDSLCYAFIEFETEESCIEAYNKMNNVLIDDRRIKVDFSQSVSKLWNKFLLKPKKESKPNGLPVQSNAPPSQAHHQSSTSGKRTEDRDQLKDSKGSRTSSYHDGDRRGRGGEEQPRGRERSRSRDRHRDSRHHDKYGGAAGSEHGSRKDYPRSSREKDRNDRSYRRSRSRSGERRYRH